MLDHPRYGNGLRLLTGLSVLAVAAMLGISTAGAQNTGATAAVSPKPQPSTQQSTASANAAQPDPARKGGDKYFVEFRSRHAMSYGHSFVVHGKVTGSRKIRPEQVAGFHPAGNSSVPWVIGHLVPVPAETGASDGDTEEIYVSARFRLVMNKPEYDRVAAFIREIQASPRPWHAVAYNCNDFVADIARFMGLKTGTTMVYPKEFVTSLRDLNSGKKKNAVAMANSHPQHR